MDIAILTQREYLSFEPEVPYVCQLQYEEALLINGFKHVGLKAARVAWDDADMDWSIPKGALFRTTWDYFHRYDAFCAWLKKVQQQTRLFNDARILQWNIDKRYLAELERSKVPVVPTAFVEKGSTALLLSICATQGWQQAVFKPVISGAARLTHRFHTNHLASVNTLFEQACASEAMMVQPFVSSVATFGEVSVIVIDGKYSHAVRKIAKPGDFRVQDDHGGFVVGYEPGRDEIALAERAIAACPTVPIYARADMVLSDEKQWQIMELELIEPELFFRFFTPGAKRLCEAIAARF